MAGLTNILESLGRSPEETRAENLRRWVSTVSGVTPIEQVEARKKFRVAGVIQNIRIDPREGTGSIEATIIDGTGQMVARWLGRQALSGIRLGMGLVMEGNVGAASDGELSMLNPEYRLVPGPEHN